MTTRTLPDSIRHRFPIVQRSVYANSCSQGALSDAVQDAYRTYLREWEDKGAPWDLWVDLNEQARLKIAVLVNAAPDEIAVTTSTSAAVSSLLSGMSFAGGRNKIVVSECEFPTIGQISHAQELIGREVVHVEASPDNTLSLERLDDALDDETALLAITYICFRNGSKTDVAEAVRIAHERGAYVLLDTYQAVGAIPIDVRELGVDFATGGTVKYLLGSAGMAFLYCRRDLLSSIVPTVTGWFADEDVNQMDIFDYSPAATARKFESGTPAVPSIYAGIAGIDLMQEIGIAETEQHVRGLTARLTEGLDDIGARIVTPRDPAHRGPLTAVATTDEAAMVTALESDGILTTARDGNVRLSLHCYNSDDDVEAMVAGLKRHANLLV